MRLGCLLALYLMAAELRGADSFHNSKPYTEVPCVNRLCRCNSNTVTCSCAGKLEQVMDLGKNNTYPGDLKFVKVENCRTVTVEGNAFKGLKHLAVINISNVANLDVDEKGFEWMERSTPLKGIIISLQNVTIEELPASAFSGNLDAVIMNNVAIQNMRTFAFMDVHKIGRIEMSRFEITIMEESVAKKMEVKTLIMTDGVIKGFVPSRAFTDIQVESEFSVENVHFNIIQSKAFSMRIHKMVRMRGCTVAQLRPEAFVLSVDDRVVFERNTFGSVDMRALSRIIPDPNNVGATFIFENNTIGDFQDGALEIHPGFREVRMERVVLQRLCNCADLDQWRRRLVTGTPSRDPQHLTLDASAVWCHVESPKGRRRPTASDDFHRLACVETAWDLPAVLIVAAVVGAAFLCFVGAATVCCRRRRQKRLKKRQSNGVPLKRVNSSKRTPGDGASHGVGDSGSGRDAADETCPLKMIVPDGRTYRETELHVIVERAEPLPDDSLTSNKSLNSQRKGSRS